VVAFQCGSFDFAKCLQPGRCPRAVRDAKLAPRWLVLALVFLLVAANTFNIAADIAAMGESLSLVIGGLNHEHALIFASTSTLLQVFVPYRRYAPVLKFLTLTLFAYVVTAFTVKIPWSTALLAAIWPKATVNTDYPFDGRGGSGDYNKSVSVFELETTMPKNPPPSTCSKCNKPMRFMLVKMGGRKFRCIDCDVPTRYNCRR
jgi:Natural resistance-associated macrophage protein